MRLRALLLALSLGFGSVDAAAQADQCNFVDLPGVSEQLQRIGELVRVEGPFLVRCTSGAELRAQRGTVNELTSEVFLDGNVDYRDATRTLTSQQATYNRPIRRLYATGDVVFHNQAEGMTIRGPELEYFAEMPERPVAQVNAGSRPHLTIQPRDGGDGDPLEIDADRLTILGQSDLSAYGSVVIQRPDLHATASEARFDGETEGLELRENAVVRGKDNVLRGAVIQARMENDELQEVHARTDAVLEAEDLTVTAPDVQLFFRDELVERTVARRGADSTAAQPVALSRTFRLVADSIDALAPDQRLERVIAIGSARGEGIDTTAAPTAEPEEGAVELAAPDPLVGSDWIVGDTIIGYFALADSAVDTPDGTAADTTVELERITARGAARSIYRMQAQSATGEPAPPSGRRSVNFVSASVITLRFQEGEVETAELEGVRRGLYLDPAPAPPSDASAPSPSAGAGAGRE